MIKHIKHIKNVPVLILPFDNQAVHLTKLKTKNVSTDSQISKLITKRYKLLLKKKTERQMPTRF
jgi:hypothetical protein